MFLNTDHIKFNSGYPAAYSDKTSKVSLTSFRGSKFSQSRGNSRQNQYSDPTVTASMTFDILDINAVHAYLAQEIVTDKICGSAGDKDSFGFKFELKRERDTPQLLISCSMPISRSVNVDAGVTECGDFELGDLDVLSSVSGINSSFPGYMLTLVFGIKAENRLSADAEKLVNNISAVFGVEPESLRQSVEQTREIYNILAEPQNQPASSLQM